MCDTYIYTLLRLVACTTAVCSAGLHRESCLLQFWEAIEDYSELLEQHPPHTVAMQKAWLLWRTFLVEGMIL